MNGIEVVYSQGFFALKKQMVIDSVTLGEDTLLLSNELTLISEQLPWIWEQDCIIHCLYWCMDLVIFVTGQDQWEDLRHFVWPVLVV